MIADMSEHLVDPRDGGPLALTVNEAAGNGEVLRGLLTANDGAQFAIRDGVANLLDPAGSGQEQTSDSFGWKWKGWQAAETPSGYELTREWFTQRYFGDDRAMREFVGTRQRILDCGCGSGLSSSVYLDDSFSGDLWAGADLSDAVYLARERLGRIPHTLFVKADMLRLPFREEYFDTIVDEGRDRRRQPPSRAGWTLSVLRLPDEVGNP
jgi:SAM-dependent methyltransferase